MSALAARPRERGVLRTMGMMLAIGLGAVAVFLVVVAHTQKQVQIGLLIGLWGVLFGTFALFGPRREADELDAAGETAGSSGSAGSTWGQRREVELVSAERREHELQLEVMLRREMERVLREELSELRGEVAGLRTDLHEKMNGQLRLERVETTRVVSSGMDELHEMRRLAVARNGSVPTLEGTAAFPPATLIEPGQRASGPLPYVFAAPPVTPGIQSAASISAVPRAQLATPRPSAAPPSASPLAASPLSAAPAGHPKPPIAGPVPSRPMGPAPTRPPASAPPSPARPMPGPIAASARPTPAPIAAVRPTPAPAGTPGADATPGVAVPGATVFGTRQAAGLTGAAPAPARTPLPVPPKPAATPPAASSPAYPPAVPPTAAPRPAYAPKPTPEQVTNVLPEVARPLPSPAPTPPSMPSVPSMPCMPEPPASIADLMRPGPSASSALPAPVESDPLAALPRLSRFDLDIDVDEPSRSALPPQGPAPAAAARPPQYVGRRRQANGVPTTNGHSPTNGTNGARPTNGDDNHLAGGRRRRRDEDADDVLARLLGR